MKDYMASGSFARGKEKNALASMVFVGNINQSLDVLLKTSHLFAPFPEDMANDRAFFDRMHYYIPGWEIPKMRTEYFTDKYGFIVDYLAEFIGLCSGALDRPVQDSLVVFGNMTVGGTIPKVENFANMLQVAVDAGAKKALIPAAAVADYQTVPGDLIVKIQPIFYSDPIDVVFKALGAV